MTTYSDVTDAHHYRPGYNPAFVAKVMRKREAAARKAAIRSEAEAALKREQEAEAARQELQQAAEAESSRNAVDEYRVIDLTDPASIRLPARQIIDRVSLSHGITYGEITGPSRTAPIVAARHEAMYEVKRLRPDLSLPQIGKIFGGKDHTTVLHAFRKVEAQRAKEAR